MSFPGFIAGLPVWGCQLAAVCLLLSPGVHAQTSESGEFRTFTNKEGREVNARIVSMSSDRRTLKLSLEDGREAELPIVSLSLDDQLYLKGWLASQSAQAEYRLEVSISKVSAAPEERRREEYYKLNTQHQAYRVNVRNMSRETLTKPVVEYFLLKEETVDIYQDEDTGEWTFSTFSSADDFERKPESIHGTETLDDLVYNRDLEFTTSPMEIDTVLADGNTLYSEDKIVGMIMQIRDGFGNLVGTFRSAEAGIRQIRWEDLPEADRMDQTAAPMPEPKPEPKPLVFQELDSFPALFQKGQFVKTVLVPNPAGLSISITAKVDLDEDSPNGTIVACGGRVKGFCLVVHDGELQFWMRSSVTVDGKRSSQISVPVSELPAGEFLVKASNSSSGMTLSIDGEIKASGTTIGLLDSRPNEGISVGFDSENQAVGPGSPPDPFAGAIRDVQIELGN